MNEHLMTAVLYAALFFETSTEGECDLDLAVKQLEEIAYHLRQLSPAEQEEFRGYAHSLANKDPGPAGDELRRLVDGLLPLDEFW
jgi:hypothetical protein